MELRQLSVSATKRLEMPAIAVTDPAKSPAFTESSVPKPRPTPNGTIHRRGLRTPEPYPHRHRSPQNPANPLPCLVRERAIQSAPEWRFDFRPVSDNFFFVPV